MDTRLGRSPETAYVVNDSNGEITASTGQILSHLLGGNDGDYFVLSETTLDKRDVNKRYKVLFVEDANNEKHTIFLEVGVCS